MTNFNLYYCYDAYCGWCYGFSPVIKKLQEQYKDQLGFEVLSGGMIIDEAVQHVSVMAEYIRGAYTQVEKTSGVQFGSDYLWHINNPNDSDWFPGSEKPAIALCVLKDYAPDRQVEFIADLQYSLFYEGRDLCDDEAYRHLLEKYDLPVEAFYDKLRSESYKEQAHYEFALVKQLQVTGFPTLLLQVTASKFHLIAVGFTPYETVAERLEAVLKSESV
jgi:putative protein-disulfide isomerase